MDGELAEDTWDWFAEDEDGNVWYLGEETCEYEEDQIVSDEGAVLDTPFRDMLPFMNRWYQDGIRFECTACGDCCRTHGEYAFVFLAARDVTAIADHLGMSRIDFLNAYCASDADGAIYLRKVEGDCDFLTADGGCRVYPVRPRQCEAWPFWSENLDDEETWRGPVAACCPGIGRGRHYAADEISRIARERDDWYDRDTEES